MNEKFLDLPLSSTQSTFIENARLLQEVTGKQIKSLQKQVFETEDRIKKFKMEIKALETELQDLYQQMGSLVPTQTCYEKAIETLMDSVGVKPPYQGTLIYDKTKPIALRLPAPDKPQP